MRFVASAPGKVVLLGEYAVLEGAPAQVQAVAVRARATVETGVGGCEIAAPQVLPAPIPFSRDAHGCPRWPRTAGAERLALVEQVLRGLGERGLLPAGGLRIELDTAAFFVDGGQRKLGLGSSAALTVALASALAAAAGAGDRLADRRAWLRELLVLHRAFQGGRGSGADLAAALHGGLLRYRLREGDRPQVLAQNWPRSLHRLYVWTGSSASTGDYLARLASWRAQRPQRYAECFAELRRVAEAGDTAIINGDVPALLEAYRGYAAALQKLGETATIPIYSAEHRRIEALVHAAGGVYKPCGAGGGDLGMALLTDADRLPSLRSDLAQAGFECPQLADDSVGLELETFGAS